MVATANPPRMLSPGELGAFIKVAREVRKWSQEQLAEIAGLSTRTVQRVENGEPSGTDTRRALARAFEFDDIDVLNKPFKIPTAEELTAQRAAFERDHIRLKALPLETGRQLAGLVEQHEMGLTTPGFDMDRPAEEVFAVLTDYINEYRDSHELYSSTDKLDLHDELQGYIDQLKDLGVSLRYAQRKVALKVNAEPGAEPMRASVLYVVTFRRGKEPEEFATPRQGRVG
ncbi:helix-turn-helix transcriptional regulator [Paucibacter sp. R3-3]|uniref:Helix-turn-helix transcriptional regulator n=1 Tax=Roseateles agri TaxID=3098619 RepID=A0ABU5DET0_9BURK|nr:helix-turn-helix transcriptional regulator [Paucibacter sp. R3-3]MDY0744776.1 helix-turn-helix transcriptional regulator [Paucibacter sp. R3-3]